MPLRPSTYYGHGLEQYTQAELEKILDNADRPIKVWAANKKGGRGNQTASDIFTHGVQIECKRRNQNDKHTNTIIKKEWWEKLARRAGVNGKIPAVVTSELNLHNAMITMRLTDFISLVDPECI